MSINYKFYLYGFAALSAAISCALLLPTAEAEMISASSDSVTVTEYCTIRKNGDNELRYSIDWDSVRSDRDAEQCITEVAKLAGDPYTMSDWLRIMGFRDAKIIYDDNIVAIEASWSYNENRSSAPYGNKIINFLKGITSNGRSITLHISFGKSKEITTQITRTIL